MKVKVVNGNIFQLSTTSVTLPVEHVKNTHHRSSILINSINLRIESDVHADSCERHKF